MSLHDDFGVEFEAMAPYMQEQLLTLARAVEITNRTH